MRRVRRGSTRTAARQGHAWAFGCIALSLAEANAVILVTAAEIWGTLQLCHKIWQTPEKVL